MKKETVTPINDFPEELILPIKALSNKTRRKLILALLKNNEFSYTQLQTDSKIGKGTLNHHLHKLVSAGLIRNFTKSLPVSQYSSYYQVTNFGCLFVEGLLQSFSEPKMAEGMQLLQSTTYSARTPFGTSVTSFEDEPLSVELVPRNTCLVNNK